MSSEEGVAHVLRMFDRSSSRDPNLVGHFTDDVDEAIADARQRLDGKVHCLEEAYTFSND